MRKRGNLLRSDNAPQRRIARKEKKNQDLEVFYALPRLCEAAFSLSQRGEKMQERVLEVLVYLIGEFNQQQGSLNDINALSQGLVGLGYTENEINTAFSWLAERLRAQSTAISSDEGMEEAASGHRMLHDVERLILTPKAYGYLIQLKELGLIDAFQMEAIIERAMLMGSKNVTEEDIKALASSVLFESEGMAAPTGGYTMFGPEGEHSIN
jgi:uncharacterized protein Smg (DUF494 family)